MNSPRFVQNNYGGYVKLVDSNAVAGQELEIFTIATENLEYFIDIAGSGLVVQGSDEVVIAESASKGGSASVSRYPGDPSPYNRTNAPRKIMKNRFVRHGSALPGRRFVLEDGTERRQFTYNGNLSALHALLVGNLKMEVRMINYNGAWEIISPAGEATTRGAAGVDVV